MTATPTIRLHNRAVLAVGGEERADFLQGLISNDVGKMAGGNAIYAALLTPQGKFLFDLFIVPRGDALLVDCEAARAEDLRKKLSMYKLRAKVTITATDLEVWAGPAEGYADPRLPEMGTRAIVPPGTLTETGSFAEWDARRIRLGLPDGSRDLPVEKAILLENGFEELNGVDFAKGCYMGQELTARTKYRGLVRKRLMPVEITGPAPEAGAAVMCGEVEAGEMRSSCGDVGLALIRLEQFRAGGPFTCGGATLKPWKPDWAVFPEGD